MEFVTSGFVRGGVLTVRNRQKLLDAVAQWRDCECTVTVEKAHATRSLAQNDYYHAVVVARIAAYWKRNVKETHEVMKATFLPHEKAQKGENGVLMNGYVIGGSTAKLNKLEFVEYLEAIVMHFAERGLVIPDPDPMWRAHAEAEAEKELAQCD